MLHNKNKLTSFLHHVGYESSSLREHSLMTSHAFWLFLTYLPTLSYSITSHFRGYLRPPLPTLIWDVNNECSLTTLVRNLWFLFPLALVLSLSSRHQKVIKFINSSNIQTSKSSCINTLKMFAKRWGLDVFHLTLCQFLIC